MAARDPQKLTAVVLAAGESSRFWPLSTHGHKALHRLGGKAIIEHTVASLVGAGIIDIIVVQSPIARAAHFPHRTVSDQLGDGRRLGARIRYVDQAEAIGQGDAILRAAPMLDGEFVVVQPENINAGEIVKELLGIPGNVMAVQERQETWLFGVCAVDGGIVTDIIEKPERGTEPSKLCNMWVAKLDSDYLRHLKEAPPSLISSVTALQTLGYERKLRYVVSGHPFFPLKYPWHLFAMAEHLRDETKPFIGEGVTVHPTAAIAGSCVIESDCVIGEHVSLTRCIIGAGSNIGSSLANSIIGAAAVIEDDVTVDDRPDHAGEIAANVKGQTVMTGMPRLGVVVGQGSRLRQGCRITPGVMIGAECDTAGVQVTANVPDRSRSTFEKAGGK